MVWSYLKSIHGALAPTGRTSLRVLVALSLLLQLVLPFVTATPAYAAVNSAAFSGGPGTATVGGVLFAKSGQGLTLTVTTSTGVRCVMLTGDISQTKLTGPATQTTWIHALTAGLGDGLKTVTAAAFLSPSGNPCTTDPSGSLNASYTLDNTAPALTGAATASPNVNGWYKGDVIIDWTCSDSGSGIAAGACPADSTITGEGSNLSATASVSDRVGNPKSTTVDGIMIDRTAPATTASAPPAWNNINVTVTLTATDNLSGVDSTHFKVDGGSAQPGTSISFSTDGIHSLEFWSIDKAGNEETHKTIQVKIDKTPPTIGHTLSPAANASGWNNQTEVTVTFSCSDDLSDIASCTGPQEVTAEGKGQVVTGTATDNAGNSASDPATVNIDRTKPTIIGSRNPAANSDGWNNTDVTASFVCDDPDSPPGGADDASGIKSCTAAVVLQNEGTNQSVTGTAADTADNSASTTVSGISIDKTKPTLTGTASPQPNGNGWNNSDVTITWTCSDALSGLNSTCPSDNTITTEGSGQSASASISDKAGNSTNAIVGNVNIDKTAPSVAITSPTNSASISSATTAVSGTASDSVSAVASVKVNGQATSYDSLTGEFSIASVSLTCGANTITAEAVDLAGNTKSASVPVTRSCYSLNFLQPLDQSSSQATVKNLAKYGRTLPIKVEILQGSTEQDSSNVASTPTVKVVGAACSVGGAVDDIEVYADAGQSSGNTSQFRWSADSPGFWIYNLDTKALGLQVDKCYRIDVYIGAEQVTTAKWGFLQVTK